MKALVREESFRFTVKPDITTPEGRVVLPAVLKEDPALSSWMSDGLAEIEVCKETHSFLHVRCGEHQRCYRLWVHETVACEAERVLRKLHFAIYDCIHFAKLGKKDQRAARRRLALANA